MTLLGAIALADRVLIAGDSVHLITSDKGLVESVTPADKIIQAQAMPSIGFGPGGFASQRAATPKALAAPRNESPMGVGTRQRLGPV
jgi:hypothetical protein